MESSSYGPEWWDQLCAQLERDPVKTTEVITAFKDSPHSFDLSLQYISTPSLLPISKFHALQVFQFSLLVKKWGVMSSAEKVDITQMVWKMLSDDIALNVQDMSPNYLTGKFMQTFAALLKRLWNENVESSFKLAVLTEMSGLFQNSVSLYNGAKLFKIMIEEFSFRSSVEQGLPIEFHRLAQSSFEEIGLDQSLELAFRSTSSLLLSILPQLQGGANSSTLDPNLKQDIATLNECCLLYSDILAWSVQGDDIMASESERNLSNARISDAWVPCVRNEQFINDLVDAYFLLRNSSVASVLDCEDNLLVLLSSIRSILMIFISARQKFATPDEEVLFSNFLLSKCHALMNACMSDIPDQFLSNSEFRSQECDGLSNILNRLFLKLDYSQIIKLPEFQNSFMAVSNCIIELCKELDMMSLYYLSRSRDDSATPKAILSSSKKMHNAIKFEDDDLLINWRHSAIYNCIELFSHFTVLIEKEASENNHKVSDETHLNSALAHVCPQIFIKLYETYTKLIVGDSMVHKDEEEVDEQEEISQRTITEAVQKTCIIGRVCFVEACSFVTRVTTANLDAVLREPGGGSDAELEKLEELRTSLMFASHIISSAFTSDDDRSVPTYISLSLETNCKVALDSLLGLVGLVHKIGQEQIAAVTTNLQSPILSPLIISSVLTFLEEFYCIYINCDTLSSEVASFLANEETIGPILEVIMQMTLLVVRFFPLQNDLVKNVSNLLIAVSYLGKHDDDIGEVMDRISEIIQLPIFSEIYTEVLGQSNISSTGFSRLNSEGIACLFRGLGSLIANGRNVDIFTQICSSIHTEFLKISESPIDEMKTSFDQNLSCLSGMAKLKLSSASGACVHLLNETLDACLPMVCQLLDAKFDQYDDIIQLFMTVLADYSSKQVQTMPSKSSVILFQAAAHSMKTLSTRMSRSNDGADERSREVEDFFKNTMIYILLQLLNHLSDRDNSIEDSESVNLESEKQIIVETLFFGLQCVIPWISVEILMSFPATAERYFAFLLYLNQSYIDEFAAYLLQMEDQGYRLMEVLFDQLLWAAGAIDKTIAHRALDSIFCFGKFQLMNTTQVFPLQPTAACAGYSILFNKVLEQLLSMLLFVETGTLSASIGYDRLDSAANALLVLISIDYAQFQAIVQSIVSSQVNASFKDAILASFQRLVSIDSINFHNSREFMKTRRDFAKNLNEFIKEIRPLLTFK